jgi:hypothetical protein
MMQSIPRGELSYFCDRFYKFGDGVVRTISVSYYRSDSPTVVELRLSVLDSERTEEDDQWVDLILRFIGVVEFSFNEGNISWQVAFDGNLCQLAENICLNLDANVDTTPSSIHNSKFYVLATEVRWKTVETTVS